MISMEHSADRDEEVNDFLKLHEKDLEREAIKLTKFYSTDLHELLSRTRVTVWKKWRGELCNLSHNESYRYTLRILANHARNLSKGARRDWSKFEPVPNEALERLVRVTTWRDPAVEIVFKDDRLAIYNAISLLEGRCRDVMVLIALALIIHGVGRLTTGTAFGDLYLRF
ncbi:MAG: hypothetical protein LC808_12135 [Actinobacteria bacterium]|nr:hypothetical protein [Actinomycetota bacterium]